MNLVLGKPLLSLSLSFFACHMGNLDPMGVSGDDVDQMLETAGVPVLSLGSVRRAVIH